jgi:hypothetical protein
MTKPLSQIATECVNSIGGSLISPHQHYHNKKRILAALREAVGQMEPYTRHESNCALVERKACSCGLDQLTGGLECDS